jgi:ABC-type transport system involved in multi-copper enzyme maturation permease subunit
MTKVLAIARNTAREAVRNKILYSILAFAVLVVAVAALFGSASIGNQMKFVKDFSFMAVSLFGVVIAIALGVNMLGKEFGRRTILNVLSKPVARWQFIVGKFLGLVATLALVVALMCAALIAIVGAIEGRVDVGLVAVAATVVIELTVVVAAALLFSAIVVTPTLAGLFTAGVFVAGRSAGYLAFFTGDERAPVLRIAARGLYWMLPHLDRLNIADRVAYGDPVSAAYLGGAAAYALAYAGVLLVLTVVLFERREFV